MKDHTFLLSKLGLIGVANLLVSLSTILLIPILTKNLSVSDYGIWNQLLVTIRILTSISCLGLNLAMLRFFPIMEKNELKIEFSSLFIVVLISSSFISSLFILFNQPLADLLLQPNDNLIIILAFSILLSCLNFISIDLFRTLNQFKKYSFFLIFQAYITLAFISTIAMMGFGINAVLFGFMISQIITFILVFILIYHEIGFKLNVSKKTKSYISYSLPLIPGFISYWVVESSDRYLIGIFLGLSSVGYYSPGYMIATAIPMIVSPFAVVLLPLLSKEYDIGNHKKVEELLCLSFKGFLGISIPVVFLLSFLSKPLLEILTTPTIAANGYLVTPLVAMGALFYGIYVIISNIIFLEKKTRAIGIIWLLVALLNIILNIIFLPIFGLLWAAFTTLLSYLIALILTLTLITNFKVYFEMKFIIKSILSSIIMVLPIFLIQPRGIISLIIVTIISAFIYLIILLIIKGITIKEYKMLKSIIKSLFAR